MDMKNMFSDFAGGFDDFLKRAAEDGDDGTMQCNRDVAELHRQQDLKRKKDIETRAFLRFSSSFLAGKEGSDINLRLDVIDLMRDIDYAITVLCRCCDVVNFTDADRARVAKVKEYLGMVLAGIQQFTAILDGGNDGK